MIYIYERNPNIEYEFMKQTREVPYWSASSQPPSSGSNHTIYMRDSEAEIHAIVPDINDPYPMAVIPSFTYKHIGQYSGSPDLSISWASTPFSPSGFDLGVHLIKNYFDYFSTYNRTTQIIKITVTYSGQNQVYWYQLDPRPGFTQHIAFYWNGVYGPWEDTEEVIWASQAPIITEKPVATQWVPTGEATHDGNWKPFKHLVPFAINKKKDETLDNAVVFRLTRNKEHIPKGSWVKLVDGEEETHWIVESCGNSRQGTVWKQEINLIEATEILKGYVLDNLVTTQPLNRDQYHRPKTLRNEVERFIITAITHSKWDGGNNKDLSKLIMLASDDRLATVAPEDSYTECTLFDALVKIGLAIDSMPKINFSYDDKLVLTFEPLDIKEKTNYEINETIEENFSESIVDYADQIVSTVYNAESKVPITYPGGDDAGTKISTEGSLSPTDLDFSKGFIQLPMKIKKMSKWWIKMDTESSKWNDFSDWIYEYGEWQLLDPRSVSDYINIVDIPVNKRQPYTAYYKRNEDKIYFGDDFMGDWLEELSDGGSYWNDFLEQLIGDLVPFFDWIINADNIVKFLMRYKAEFITSVDTKIKFGKDETNNYSVISNQGGNTIDLLAFGRNHNSLLKRMKHGDYFVRKLYKNFDSIPEVGHLVNDEYVITNLSYTRYASHYDVTLQLNKDYVRRSELIQLKQEIRSWEIPADKVENRFINYYEEVRLSFEPIQKEKSTKIRSIFALLPILNIGLPDYRASHPGLFAGLNFKASVKNYYILTQPIISHTDDSLLIHINAMDNTLFGHRLVPIGNKKMYQRGVTYTDEYGEFNNVDIQIFPMTKTILDNLEDPSLVSMPSMTKSDWEFIRPRGSVQISDLIVNKGANETFRFTYQIKFKPENGLKLTSNFFAYNGSTTGWYDDIIPYIYFLNQYGTTIKSIKLEESFGVADTIAVEYTFDSEEVPDDFSSFGLGVKVGNSHKIMMIQEGNGQYDQLVNGKILLYKDY